MLDSTFTMSFVLVVKRRTHKEASRGPPIRHLTTSPSLPNVIKVEINTSFPRSIHPPRAISLMSDRAAAIPRSSGVCCSSIVGEEEVASAECSTLVVEVDNKVNA